LFVPVATGTNKRILPYHFSVLIISSRHACRSWVFEIPETGIAVSFHLCCVVNQGNCVELLDPALCVPTDLFKPPGQNSACISSEAIGKKSRNMAEHVDPPAIEVK
jgi:hypothetical protein